MRSVGRWNQNNNYNNKIIIWSADVRFKFINIAHRVS